MAMERVEALVIHQRWESNRHGGEEEDCNRHHATWFLSTREMGRKNQPQQQPDKGTSRMDARIARFTEGKRKPSRQC